MLIFVLVMMAVLLASMQLGSWFAHKDITGSAGKDGPDSF